MDNSFDLLKIYGLPPARYNENDPNELYYSNLPSLEQIASYNLALQNQSAGNTSTQVNMSPQGLPPVPQINPDMSTPATTIGMDANDITSILNPSNNAQLSASAQLPQLGTASGSVSQQITDFSRPYPVTAESIQYLNGFIRTQIGRRVQVDFLIGNNEIITKDGFLLGVGANYILLNEIGTNDITACDFYNIKFIRFLY
ncbi:MAG: hypothetical protein IJ298_04760 [Ruminococcus sp.]|nr:hypothetical protein [Ruminococcus sp.]